jgi:MarR family transcriptional regulator for hemolysin
VGQQPVPERSIGFLLTDVSRLLRRDFDRRVRALDLTQAQWRAIAHLSREEGINQSALAERLEVKPITLARLIDRMETAGWVTRKADRADRRASLLFLTAKARPILTQLQAHAEGAIEDAMSGLPMARRRELVSALDCMKQNLLTTIAAAESGAGKRKNDDVRARTK